MLFSLSPFEDDKNYHSVKAEDAQNIEGSAVKTPDFKGTVSDQKELRRPFYEDHTDQILYNNRSELKVLVSRIAMHLKIELRNDLFAQIDTLLDLDAFEEDDCLISTNSFSTFLMFVSTLSNVRRPSLTVGHDGQVFCTWINQEGRIDIEFFAGKKFRIYVSRGQGEQVELFSHFGSYQSLMKFLHVNDFTMWVLNEQISKNPR